MPDHRERSLPSGDLGLYLHIPFCRHRCSYCDFNTYTTLSALRDEYVMALCRELSQVGASAAHQPTWQPLGTIYLGGGTPSLLSADMLARMMTAVRNAFELATDVEISLEANPGTVDQASLSIMRRLGINRLSLGAQSAIPHELGLLKREHDFADVINAVTASRQAGFANLNLDLIYGIPGQTLKSWEQSLTATLALEPEHLSLYCLTVESGTPMQRWLLDGQIEPPDPDLAADQYEFAADLLQEHGFEHYEISNWSRPAHQCRHNLIYWRNQSYLGIGAGSHGHAAGIRYHVVRQPRAYIRRMQVTDPAPFPLSAAVSAKHHVGRQEAMSDTMINRLRLLQEGLDVAAFEARFGQSPDEAYAGAVSQLVDWGLLSQANGTLRLTKRGRFLSNQVFYRFV